MTINEQIVEKLMEQAGVKNRTQFAKYLTEKYGLNIERQSIFQFQDSDRVNVTQLLLREAMENKKAKSTKKSK